MTILATTRGFRFPDLAETPDVPRDIGALAADVESKTARPEGSVLTATQVGEVGQIGQVRAGRLYTLADFTTLLGLGAPAGLWNLSDLTDTSGNGRTLSNKGAVPFGVGINGAAASAAVFAGSTGQALYLADAGGADTFRIRMGSWGCWARTAKRGVTQHLVTKYAVGAGLFSWLLSIDSTNVASFNGSFTGTIAGVSALGGTDVCDDRWHHIVATFDGSIVRLYVDGVLDGMGAGSGTLFGAAVPVNIGASSADGAVAAASPNFGRIDGAFVTPDVLSDDQVRLLYASKIAHSYAVTPARAQLNVTRRRRGAPLVTGDFPATPLRLYNFTAAGLTDAGSNNVPVVANAGTGAITFGAGVDGTRNGAQALSGAHAGLSATDAGLPATTTARTYSAWFKTSSATDQAIMGWGTLGTNDARMTVLGGSLAGASQAKSGSDIVTGPPVNDGLWHHFAVVEDNAAADGIRRKLYLDGRLVSGSTVLTSLTLAGADRFRVGANPDGSGPFIGMIDAVFVSALALTADQVRALYQKTGQTLGASPKNEGDHVEAFDATNVYTVFDTLEPQNLVDLRVAA